MITPVLKVSDIKKDPNIMLDLRHAFICKRSNVVAHVLSNERMEELTLIEEMHRDSDIGTAYDCAISALEMVNEELQPELFHMIEQIIICCIGDDEFQKIKNGEVK